MLESQDNYIIRHLASFRLSGMGSIIYEEIYGRNFVMCYISGSVEVSGTKLFARLDGSGNQYIVFSTEYTSANEIILIIPIPVSSHAMDAVQFVPFSHYPDFFDDLSSGFVSTNTREWIQLKQQDDDFSVELDRTNYYEAIYVSSIDGLDKISMESSGAQAELEKVNYYTEFGFVVYRLPGTNQIMMNSGNPADAAWLELRRQYGVEVVEPLRLNPVAFRFTTSEPRRIYFPTLFVNLGLGCKLAEYDHILYLQGDIIGDAFVQSQIGNVSSRADSFMNMGKAGDVVAERGCCYRKVLQGRLANHDIWAAPANIPSVAPKYIRTRVA